MQCKCCGKFYLDKDNLFSIFYFTECCPACKKTYKPKLMCEVFPINHGIVEYYYLYQNINLSIKIERFLSKHLSILFLKMIKNKDDYGVMIYFDDEMDSQIKELSWFINAFQHVFLFSLERKEIIYHSELI